MLKNLLISTLIGSATFTSLPTINSFLTRKNSPAWKDIDLSKLEFNNKKGKEHNLSDWNSTDVSINDYSFLYSDIDNIQKGLSFENKTKLKLAIALDHTLDTKEIDIVGEHNVFYNQMETDSSSFYVTILGKNKESNEKLNDPSSSFIATEKLEAKYYSSFYLRVSNNSSTDWSKNKSYFDTTINVCNFNSDDYSKSISTSDECNLNENFVKYTHTTRYDNSDDPWDIDIDSFDSLSPMYDQSISNFAYFSSITIALDIDVSHYSNEMHSDFRDAWTSGKKGLASYNLTGYVKATLNHLSTDAELKDLPKDDKGTASYEAYYYQSDGVFMDMYGKDHWAKCELQEGVYFNSATNSSNDKILITPSWRSDEIDATTGQLRINTSRKFTETINLNDPKFSVSLNKGVFITN